MNFNHKLIGFFFLGVSFSLSAGAQIDMRASCQDTRDIITYSDKTIEDYQDYLSENQISIVSPSYDIKNLEEFIFEYEKFPLSLREELIEAGAYIHLIDGNGVTDDPTWDKRNQTTFDGRTQSTVAGSGGSPFSAKLNQKYVQDMIKYCRFAHCSKDWTQEKPDVVPTRIVMNHLYPDRDPKTGYYTKYYHGSVNLVLHEHGHSLDSIYSEKGVSSSDAWNELFTDSGIRDYMKVVCLDSGYCLNNRNEAFAELFAYYHACDSTKEHMEKNAPNLASYFQNLTRIKR